MSEERIWLHCADVERQLALAEAALCRGDHEAARKHLEEPTARVPFLRMHAPRLLHGLRSARALLAMRGGAS